MRLREARVDAASVAPDRGADPSCWLCQSRAEFVGARESCLRAGFFFVLFFVRPSKCFVDHGFACGRLDAAVGRDVGSVANEEQRKTRCLGNSNLGDGL